MNVAQVIIIGGGAMGVSLLYHLAKAGWSDVVLLEKHELTHGSTWHAAGLCTHFAHHATIQALRAHSVRLYRDVLPEETGRSCGFHATGALRVTRSRDRMDEFSHVAGLSRFTGHRLDIISPERISELHPLAVVDDLLGGIHEPDDGHVDPTLATHALAEVAVSHGGLVRRRTPVRSIRRQSDRWVVDTDAGSWCAHHIVNAAGTWAWEVGRMIGLDIPVVPVLHQYLVTDRIDAVASRVAAGISELPIIRDPDESWYVRQERDGLILGPYEREAAVWSVDGVPADFGADLLPPDLERVEPIIEAALSRVPALGTGGVKTVINGPITFTPDANPLVGPVHGLDHAWLLTGSSMGVMEGGGAGWFLAHWMTHGAPPLDALAIDSRRFGRWADRGFRVATAIESFGRQFAVHYPLEERSAGRDRRLSALHSRMLAHGAVMGTINGWERPNWFADGKIASAVESFRCQPAFDAIARECERAAEAVALADLSALSKFELVGPDVATLLDSLGANSPPAPGRIGLIHALTPAGGVHSEFTVSCLSASRAYLTSASAAETIDLDLLMDRAAGLAVEIENRTESLAVIGVMGPRARALLARLTDTDLDHEFPWLSVREINVAGEPVRALRLSFLGEMGWELHIAREAAPIVFDALWSAGRPFGVGFYGAWAANAMRLEKGYRAWGLDLGTERTPLESGLHAFVRRDGRDFPGGTAMRGRRGDVSWHMVLLEIEDGSPPPFHGHPVRRDGRVVGLVTSGAFGHRTGKTLALASLRSVRAAIPLEVEILGQWWRATVLAEPPYDPEHAKPRGVAP